MKYRPASRKPKSADRCRCSETPRGLAENIVLEYPEWSAWYIEGRKCMSCKDRDAILVQRVAIDQSSTIWVCGLVCEWCSYDIQEVGHPVHDVVVNRFRRWLRQMGRV